MFGYSGNASRPVLAWDQNRNDAYQCPNIRVQTFYDDGTSSYRQRTEVYCYFAAIASAGDCVTVEGYPSTTLGSTIMKYQPGAVLITTAKRNMTIGVVSETQAATSWGWVAVQGYAENVKVASAVAAGDLLECVGGGLGGVRCASAVSGSTKNLGGGFAVALTAGTAGAWDCDIFLYGTVAEIGNGVGPSS